MWGGLPGHVERGKAPGMDRKIDDSCALIQEKTVSCTKGGPVPIRGEEPRRGGSITK